MAGRGQRRGADNFPFVVEEGALNDLFFKVYKHAAGHTFK